MDDDPRREPRAELASVAAALRAYLEWQQDAGTVGFPKRTAVATPAVETAPVPVPVPAAETVHAPVPGSAPAPAPASAPAPAPAPASAPAAETAPDRSVRLPQLAQEVASCTKCALAATRTQTVFARGNPEAQLCFVGEAPGADEDEQGLPFVGRAGQLLDRMIAAMGLVPDRDVYVCNIIKCRPPGNRRPEPEETATCIPYLHEQLALVRPRVIVALGNTSVAALLDTRLGITKLRGQWKLYRGTLVMPTYHPSYLLRPSPQQVEAKRQAWEDLQLVMKELGLELPKRG
jgi:uracil-DNA glycosylase